MKKITAIILAAGSGRRMNAGQNKLLIKANGKEVIIYTLEKFLCLDYIEKIMLVHSKSDEQFFLNLVSLSPKINLCVGGSTRTQSVKNALKSCGDCDIVLIHDGARPFVTEEIIKNTIISCEKYSSGIAAVASTDTLASLDIEGNIVGLVDRTKTIQLQTPQTFFYDDIKSAYDKIAPEDRFSDDSSVYLKYIGKPHYSEGGIYNKKITFTSDMELFNAKPMLRVGTGQDTHVFTPDKKLMLGGVNIPHTQGLLAHSDGDVVIHAIIDSLLSAANMRDIGYHFPDTDSQYKDICSLSLLKKVCDMLKYKLAINNISVIIICDAPKLKDYIEKMQEIISCTMGIDINQISIAATTTENTFTQGITAQATCLANIIGKL